MDFYESDREAPKWSAVFFDSFPAHTRLAFPVNGSASDAILAPFIFYGCIGAPVLAIGVYIMGGLRGYAFTSGWMLCAALAFALHMAVCALYALATMGDTLERLRTRHAAWLKHQAEMTERHKENIVAARHRAANSLLDELIAEGQNRRLAPLREAQARAQHLAILELALEEAFNRYRYARDITGTADVNALRQGFLRELQANPPFSPADMVLLRTSRTPAVRAMLPHTPDNEKRPV